jgi:hypothetical protein
MIIGLDFDNTIVSYDSLFHKVGLEQGLISSDFPVNKVLIRDHLRKKGIEPLWTEMQGYVYGARLNEASPYPGVISFLRVAINAGHSIKIVSHKTLHPFAGPEYDLHKAARGWISKYLIDEIGPLVSQDDACFELTKKEKIKKIEVQKCDIFLDDLPEILLAENFPATTKRCLFDPERNYTARSFPSLSIVNSWDEFLCSLTS